jgi:hypothetical protein
LEQAPRPSCRRPWGEAWWQLLMLARWRPSLHASDRGHCAGQRRARLGVTTFLASGYRDVVRLDGQHGAERSVGKEKGDCGKSLLLPFSLWG